MSTVQQVWTGRPTGEHYTIFTCSCYIAMNYSTYTYSRFVFFQYIYRSKLFAFIGDWMFFLIGWLDPLLHFYQKLTAALGARFLSASATCCSVRLHATHNLHDFALEYPGCGVSLCVCGARLFRFSLTCTRLLNNWWRFLPTRVCAVCVRNFT